MTDLPTGTVTFLFTDIEGSTRLLQQLKDAYADVIAECRRLVRTAIQERGGQEVDTEGDAVFAAFPSAREGLLAAVTAQQRLIRHPWPDGAAVRVRMGLHTGEARVVETGYVGIDVHRAARICAAAHGGQILLSDTTSALDPNHLDIIRLFTGDSQDVIANKLGKALSITGNYGTLKRKAAENSSHFAEALIRMGVADLMRGHFQRSWDLKDVLLERYRMSRGRAIAGQQRGRALEVKVGEILDALSVSYQPRCTFRGRRGKTGKCDFAIPEAANPRIVIEVKAYEATGSKQTDVLGDIAKIVAAQTPHMYIFVVTDGLGWLNRISDLRALVRLQNEGTIDMIFTGKRLEQLGKAIQQIMTREV